MRYITAHLPLLLLTAVVGCGTGALDPGAQQTTPAPICGDGSLDANEECDGGLGCTDCLCDSDFEPTSPPSLLCQAICGNGRLDAGEECDGGLRCVDCLCGAAYEATTPPSVLCRSSCGNGRINAGEECDRGLGCSNCSCDVSFEPMDPPSLHCQPMPADETLLVRPMDGIVVLFDLTVWDVRPYRGESTAVTWLAGDLIEDSVHEPQGPGSPFALFNLRTREWAGADYLGIGSRATVTAFQVQGSGDRLVAFDDGTTWDISSRDEAGSRTWQVRDDVVFYMPFGQAINLRTGRTVTLSP